MKDVELAGLLVPPQRLFSNENTDTSFVLTPERFGLVNRIFVLSDKERTLVKEFQFWMLKNNPPNHVELEHIQISLTVFYLWLKSSLEKYDISIHHFFGSIILMVINATVRILPAYLYFCNTTLRFVWLFNVSNSNYFFHKTNQPKLTT